MRKISYFDNPFALDCDKCGLDRPMSPVNAEKDITQLLNGFDSRGVIEPCPI